MRQALREELGVKPERRTRQLYEQIKSDGMSDSPDEATSDSKIQLPYVLTRLRRLHLVLTAAQNRVQRDIAAVEQALRDNAQVNFLLKVSTIALLLVISGTAVQTYAQRCGGDFVYWVRDQKGDLIDDKEKLDLKYQRYPSTSGGVVTQGGDQMFGLVHLVKHPIDENVVTPDERTEWVKVLRIKTGCGQPFAEVELEHENQKMVLRFLNMPPETNFFLDSLPFQEGTFEIDFKSDMYLKNQKLNRDGLRHTGGKYFRRGTAKTGLLVAAENWTKAKR